MLWQIAAILFVLWILGFMFSIAGVLIHIVLVLAVVMLVIHFFSGRRGAA